MTFQEIREKASAHRAGLDEYQRMCEREWICPDRTVIRVRIDPSWPDTTQASMSVGVWRPETGTHTTLNDGSILTGGFHDYNIDVRTLTAKRLHWMAIAREVVEMWIAGEIADLPATIAW